MEIILRNILAALILSLLAYGSSSAGNNTIVDDIVVHYQKGNINCDLVVCPPETVTCLVTKKNDPNDTTLFWRNRKCIGPHGVIVEYIIVEDVGIFNRSVNAFVVAGEGGLFFGSNLTPEEERKLEEKARQIQK